MPLTNLNYCRPLRFVDHIEEVAFDLGATAIQTFDERDRVFGAYRMAIYFPERLTVLAILSDNSVVRIASREYDGPEDDKLMKEIMEDEPLPALIAAWVGLAQNARDAIGFGL